MMNTRARLLTLALAAAAALPFGCGKSHPLETGEMDKVTAEELREMDLESIEKQERRDTIQENLETLLRRRAARQRAVPDDVAVEALILLRDLIPEPEAALDAALPLLRNDRDRDVRYHALRVLALYPDEERVREAVEPLKSSDDILFSGEARLILP